MLYLIRAGVNLRLFATHNMNKRCGHNYLIFQTYLIWAWILGVWEVQLIDHSAGNKKPLSSSVTEVASPIGAVLPGTVVPAVSLVNKIVLACVHSNHCLSLTSCFYLPAFFKLVVSLLFFSNHPSIYDQQNSAGDFSGIKSPIR